jgi:hypothetical protein
VANSNLSCVRSRLGLLHCLLLPIHCFLNTNMVKVRGGPSAAEWKVVFERQRGPLRL